MLHYRGACDCYFRKFRWTYVSAQSDVARFSFLGCKRDVLRFIHCPSGLFQGGAEVLSDARFFHSNKITHVVSLGKLRPAENIGLEGHLIVSRPATKKL